MCFSAEVSFAASAGLAAIGTKTIKINTPKTKLLSYIPFLFAIHQFSEGMNWLFYYDNYTIKIFFNYLYAFIEYSLWTSYMPIANYFMETNKIKRKILLLLSTIGIVYSLYWVYFLTIKNLLVYNACSFDCGGLSYFINMPQHQITISSFIYVFIISTSMLISSNKFNKIYGMVMGLAWIVASKYFLTSFGSTWCFFAAILSVIIYYSVKYQRKIS